jgi:hypothetical protein
MAGFEYKQAEEIRDALQRRQVRYLFIGESGAVLLGYPDTTQGTPLFVEKGAANCERLVGALQELGFSRHEIIDTRWPLSLHSICRMTFPRHWLLSDRISRGPLWRPWCLRLTGSAD